MIQSGRLVSRVMMLLFALASFGAGVARACTIFVLTDGREVLFCNNEDWSNPKTRIWFVAAGDERHGCVYLGFDDDWAQGGMNTEGLAFDWVAGFKEKWEADPKKELAKGNSAQRMLETCSTVEEAIAFYGKHHEPSFAYGKMLVADKTGASVILGVKEGRLHSEKLRRSRGLGLGFGMRGDFAAKMVADGLEPTPENAAKMLKATRQAGPNATKYSNVFDLNSGDILLFRADDPTEAVRLHLEKELTKGSHYYEIPRIDEQLKQKPNPLTDEMKKN